LDTCINKKPKSYI